MRKIQDTRVVSIDPLIAPRNLKDQLPVDEAMVATVVEARETVRRIIRGADQRLLCIVGPCSIHDPDARSITPSGWPSSRCGRRAAVHRDARLFRKAAHHRGMERADQRSAHGRQLRHGDGSAHRAQLLLEINRMGLGGRDRDARSDHAAIYRRPDCVVRDRRAHHRVADPSRDGERPVDAGRFQELHRRQSAGRDQRDPVGAPAACFPRHQSGRADRHRAHHRQSRYPHRAARRQEPQFRREPVSPNACGCWPRPDWSRA